jgi:CheY-like chemotaxis protein
MKKVFLVDDDPVFVFLAQKMISTVDNTLDVLLFSDGELAMQELNANKGNAEGLPDLILLDLNMPVLDGWQFLEYYAGAYATLGKDIRIYIVSSTISPEDVQRVTRYAFVTGMLIKPIEHHQLAKVFASV